MDLPDLGGGRLAAAHNRRRLEYVDHVMDSATRVIYQPTTEQGATEGVGRCTVTVELRRLLSGH